MSIQKYINTPHGLYISCCIAIIVLSLIPSVIYGGYRIFGIRMPDSVYQMRFTPYYHPEIMEGNTPGKDLYQRYLSARAWADGHSPYKKVTSEYVYKNERSPFYPPVTYWAYSKLVPLGYPVVFKIHTVGKVLIFLMAIGWVLWLARAVILIPLTLTACIACIFMTGMGFSEILQGQFELYIAAALAIAYALLFYSRISCVIFAGAMASLKISSVAFLAPFLLVAFVADRKRWRYLLGIPLVMLLALLPFINHIIGFVSHIFSHEFMQTGLYANRSSNGLSFSLILPYHLAKSVIVLSTLLIILALLRVKKEKRGQAFLSSSLPLMIMLILQSAGFGTRAWGYKGILLLAVLPGLYIWLSETFVCLRLKQLVAVSYIFSLVVLLHMSKSELYVFSHLPNRHSWLYFSLSILFLIISLFVVMVPKWSQTDKQI